MAIPTNVHRVSARIKNRLFSTRGIRYWLGAILAAVFVPMPSSWAGGAGADAVPPTLPVEGQALSFFDSAGCLSAFGFTDRPDAAPDYCLSVDGVGAGNPFGQALTLDTELRLDGPAGRPAGAGFNFFADPAAEAVTPSSLTVTGSLLRQDNFFLNGSFGYGNETRYHLFGVQDGGGLSRTDDDASHFSLALDAGYALGDGALTFTPNSRLHYRQADLDALTELGAESGDGLGNGLGNGLHALGTDDSLSSLTLSLGGEVAYAMDQSWGMLLPFASFRWVHEFDEDSPIVNSGSWSRSALKLTGEQNDQDYFNLGVGFSARFSDGAAGFINYEKLLGHEAVDDYSINAGIRFDF